LVITIVLKPRSGRFIQESAPKFVRYNELYVAFGTIIVSWNRILKLISYKASRRIFILELRT